MTSDCGAGVSPAGFNHWMAGGTPALQKSRPEFRLLSAFVRHRAGELETSLQKQIGRSPKTSPNLFLKPVWDRSDYFFLTAFLAAGFLAAAFFAGAFVTAFLAAGFLAAAFFAGAFLAGAFFLAVGINFPPFFPQMRESCCEKVVNNSRSV